MSTAEWIASVKTCVPLVNLTYPCMAGWGQTADQYEPQSARRNAEKAKNALRTCVLCGSKVHMNLQGWLPPCRPDGLRWQGKVQIASGR
jgi:hypothetical protein